MGKGADCLPDTHSLLLPGYAHPDIVRGGYVRSWPLPLGFPASFAARERSVPCGPILVNKTERKSAWRILGKHLIS